jgi:hypothetical protein
MQCQQSRTVCPFETVCSPEEQSGLRTANATKEGVQAAAIIAIQNKREDHEQIISPEHMIVCMHDVSHTVACHFDSATALELPVRRVTFVSKSTSPAANVTSSIRVPCLTAKLVRIPASPSMLWV